MKDERDAVKIVDIRVGGKEKDSQYLYGADLALHSTPTTEVMKMSDVDLPVMDVIYFFS